MKNINEDGVLVYGTNQNGLVTFGICTVKIPTTANIYASTCLLLGNDGKLYSNGGTSTSPSFQDINEISTSEIAAGAITVDKLASNAVETAKIKDANVTASKLASNAVETAKIKDANVTLAKLATGITASHIVKFFVLGSTITDTTLTGLITGDLIVTIKIDGTVIVETCATNDTLPTNPADDSYLIVFRATE